MPGPGPGSRARRSRRELSGAETFACLAVKALCVLIPSMDGAGFGLLDHGLQVSE
jgi:hypothetical protein